MRTLVISLMLLALLSAFQASASDKEIWACRTLNPAAEPIIHLVEWGSSSYVKFTHARFGAVYQAEEGRRGWYWNNSNAGYYRYGIVLEEDGKAWLHDFSKKDAEGLSPPIDQLECSVL